MRWVWTVIRIAFIVISGWYAYLQLQERMEGSTLWCLTGFAVLGVALVLGALTQLTRGRGMARALARRREPAWAEGSRVAVIGEVVPPAEPLQSPFTARSCVAYEYRVFRRVVQYSRESSGRTERRHHTETVACGLAQHPFSIRTDRGEIAVAGVALLTDVDEQQLSDPDLRARAEALLAATETLNLSGSPVSMLKTLLKGVGGTEGRISGHWRKRGAPLDLTGWTLAEKCVEVGAQVCVVGAWHATSQSISPASGEALELVLGGEEEARRRWVGGSRSSALLGSFFGLLFLAMTTAFWWAAGWAEIGPDSATFPGEVLEGDLDAIQRQLEAGTDPDMRDTFGDPLLFATRDPETVQALLGGGADPDIRNRNGSTRLQHAALRGETEIVRALLGAGADPDQAGSGDETPVLAALRGGRWEVLDLLLAAGAKEPRVLSSSGLPLTDSDEPVQVVGRYLNAIQRQDREAIARYIGPDRVEGVDLNTWAGSFPTEVRLIRGYASDEAATLEVAGVVGEGEEVGERRWVYLLTRSREKGEWTIQRHWDSGPEGMHWGDSEQEESAPTTRNDPE